jgi:hypothetical protein
MRYVSLANALALACLVTAGGAHAAEITAAANAKTRTPFDVVRTEIKTEGDTAVFRIAVSGEAGADRPAATGTFAGSRVHAYVWPTSLDSSAVAFDPKQGIVALAVTFHPDFDDGAHGVKNSAVWHTHWVVLAKDAACQGGLKVVDIPAGTKPRLPATWPGVPLLIDSPDYPPAITGHEVSVRVPLANIGGIVGASYDGVTAALHINADLHAPLLCVADVFKVASGDLSLPGKVQ